MIERRKFKDSYDWVVVGKSPSAILAGAILGKLGLSVLFVPGTDYVDSGPGTYSDDLSNVPVYLLGLGQGELGEKMFKYLGASPQDLKRWIEPSFSTLRNNRRDRAQWETWKELCIWMNSDFGHVMDWMEHNHTQWNDLSSPKWYGVFPEVEFDAPSSSNLRNVIDQFVSVRKKRANEKLKSKSFGAELQKFNAWTLRPSVIQGLKQAMGLFANEPTAWDPTALGFLKSGSRIKGGNEKWLQCLHALAKSSGGHVHWDSRLRGIFEEDGDIKGVLLEGRNQIVEVGAMFWGLPTNSAALERVLKRKGLVKGSQGKQLVRVAKAKLDSKCVPDFLPKRAIYLYDGAPLEMEWSDPGEYRDLKAGERYVFFTQRSLPEDAKGMDLKQAVIAMNEFFGIERDVLESLEFKVTEARYPCALENKQGKSMAEPLGAGPKRLKGIHNLWICHEENRREVGAFATFPLAIEASAVGAAFSGVAPLKI